MALRCVTQVWIQPSGSERETGGGGLDPQEQVCEAFKERLLLLRSLTLGHLSLSRVIFRTVENGAKQGGTWGAEAFYRYSKCHPVDPPH